MKAKASKTTALLVGVAVSALTVLSTTLDAWSVSVEYNEFWTIDEQALIERVIDEMSELSFQEEEEIYHTIKIFDRNKGLMETVTLREGEGIADEFTQRIMNQAEFLSSYGNTWIYQVSE